MPLTYLCYMLSIHLQQLRFYANHGLYKEEKIIGNEFEVDVTVKYYPPQLPVNEIQQTIDYASIFQLVKERMTQPVDLLETFVSETALAIIKQFKLADEVYISIKKLHPPLVNFEGSVAVSFEVKRSELVKK